MREFYLSKIEEIMEGPEKDRWDELKKLQEDIKETGYFLFKRYIIKRISESFTEIIDERNSNALELEEMISDTNDPKSLEEAQDCLIETDLFKKDYLRLSRQIKNKIDRFQKLEQKRLDEIVLKTAFSQHSIPEINIEKARILHYPPPVTETELRPVNNIFKVIFNFGEKQAEFRAQQYQYIYSCFEGVSTKRDVVIEGPTGLGKTRALLAATIPHLLSNPDLRLIYTTRTRTQVNNVMDEIRDILSQNDLDLTATLHIGSTKLRDKYANCYDAKEDFEIVNTERAEKDPPLPPLDDTFCNYNCTKFTSRYKSSFDLESIRLVTINTLVESDSCPRGIMEKATEEARIVVIPHNYLYDSFWMERYDLEEGILIVDEAHNFLADAANTPYLTIGDRSEEIREEDRQTNAFYLKDMISNFLKNYDSGKKNTGYPIKIEGLELRDAALFIRCLYKELSEIIIAQHNEKNIVSQDGAPPAFFIEDISDLADSCSEELKANIIRLRNYFAKAKSEIIDDDDYSNNVKEGVYSCSQLLDGLIEVIENPMDYLLVSREGEFKFHNLHPKKNVERATERFDTKIFTSATLSPQKDVAYLLGLKDPITTEIDPVFPEINYRHFFITGVNSSSKEELREEDNKFNHSEHKVIEDLFSTAIDAASGKNIGIFCSSIPVVIETHEILKAIQQERDFLLLPFIQGSRYAETIEKFREDYQRAASDLNMDNGTYTDDDVINVFKTLGDDDRTAVILGVQGGTLSEGVDYRAEQMEMVITLGLPYPASAAERRLNQIRQDYFFMQGMDRQAAEDLAYKQEAFRKVAQSIGRSHRSMTDRAVVILADERLLSIKKVQEDLPNRYEYLSPQNAKKNLKLLQRPVQKLKKNLVIGGEDKSENRILADYISTGMGVTKTDFINFKRMAARIREFYK